MPVQTEATKFLDLPLDRILEDADNVRRTLVGIDELAESVRQDGVIEPIVVRPHPERDGFFLTIAGHRRVAAARKVGLPTVPAVVRDVSDNDKCAMQLTENIQREDLSAIEVAQALQGLMTQTGGKAADVGARIGQTANWVNKHLALLKTQGPVVEAMQRARLNLSQAREIRAIAADREAGAVERALAAIAGLKSGAVKRDELRKKPKAPASGDEKADVAQAAGNMQQLFEKRGEGYSIRILVEPRVTIDSNLKARIEAALTSVERIIGEAA